MIKKATYSFLMVLFASHCLAQKAFYTTDAQSRMCVVWKHSDDMKTNNTIDTVFRCEDCIAMGNNLFTLSFINRVIDGRPILSVARCRIVKDQVVEMKRFEYQTKKKINFNKYRFFFQGSNFVIDVLENESCERKIVFKLAVQDINNQTISTIGL